MTFLALNSDYQLPQKVADFLKLKILKGICLLGIILFFIPSKIPAQEKLQIQIHGKIIAEDSVAVAYANISRIKDRSIGTYSDLNGQFQLNLPSNSETDTILITCIGYKDLKLALHQTVETLTIILSAKSYVLPEIIISTDSALSIVKKAVERLKFNLSDKKNILQGFYREMVRSNATYDRLVEAAVDVFDNGYNPELGNGNLKFRIRELRKSEDYIDLDWKASVLNYLYPKNGLHGKSAPGGVFINDYIRNNQNRFVPLVNGPLNGKFFEYVKFSIDSVLHYDDYKLFCLGIYKGINEEDDRMPSGHIYIRNTDYAIFQMDYAISVDQNHPINDLATPGEDFLHKTLIKYQEYEGKMYLSMLWRRSFRLQINYTQAEKTNGEDGQFFDEMLFIVNEIITKNTKPLKFKYKNQQKRNIDLYSEEWTYNEGFWKSYNIINDNPLNPSIIKDLERENSLKDQFEKND